VLLRPFDLHANCDKYFFRAQRHAGNGNTFGLLNT
jgi:hypothetical protein